jgi:hypothetical protein
MLAQDVKPLERELLDHLYQVLLEAENDELPNPDRIRKARADYAACEEWYARKYSVDMEVAS